MSLLAEVHVYAQTYQCKTEAPKYNCYCSLSNWPQIIAATIMRELHNIYNLLISSEMAVAVQTL
jgi:hypothetical protein